MKKFLIPGLTALTLILLLIGYGSPSNEAAKNPVKADYSHIPVYTLDGQSAYLNAEKTPLEFFSVSCPHCQKDVPKIQRFVDELKTPNPLTYVAVFPAAIAHQEAIQETKEFIAKYKMHATVFIQANDPRRYVPAVPSLVVTNPGRIAMTNITVGMPSKEQLSAVLAR